MEIRIPVPAEEIINKLNEHGYEAYVVGGCVRDMLLGREPGDWDITTSALPGQVKEVFRRTVDTVNNKPGFVKAMWCGCLECEEKIKEVAGATSRCIPFEQENLSDKCVCCGKPAKKMVYWGKAY